MTNDSSLPAEAAAFVREFAGEEWTAKPLAGDASVRAYFRIVLPDGTTHMLAYYPVEVRPQLQRFLTAHAAVSSHGRIPEILHYSESSILQADVGDHTLYELLHEDRQAALDGYGRAIDLLVAFQGAPGAEINPPFSAEFFAAELAMTREFYVEKLMAVPAGKAEALQEIFQRLAENVARHPYVLCHRDYHGQNIHVFNDTLYIIDYQDLRMGPDTYDLASLLRDRGVARLIGDAHERGLVDHYRRRIGAGESLTTRYFETLLQRSVKVLGTFSKQPLVRGKLHYLDFIPSTLESIRRCVAELPQFKELETLLPMSFALEETRERLRKDHLGQA